MCACYFRAQGEDFDVDSFLADSPWQATATAYRKGESKSRGVQPRERSGLSLTVIDDDNATISQQVTACRTFMNDHLQELIRLKSYAGVDARWFSLAYYLPIGEVYAVCPYFESDFLSELVGIGAEFEFNVFCSSAE